ncbi:hypothetical protein SNEBB_007600 [Seison nebaliae]|nr:hypothetical protein SNEBB_007600 [Seison nebaliae]
MEEKKKNVKHLDDEYRINYILNRGYFNNISKWKGSTKDGRSVQIYLRFSKLSGRLNDRYVDLSQLLLPCKHPHILQHLNAFVDDVIIDDTVYLSFAVMEYLPDYDLFMEIQQRSEAAFVYSEQVASYYMQQILNAFAYLASKHICHCDLKPRSIKVATMESLMRHGSEGNMMPTIKVTELENARVILPNEFAQKHIRVALTPAMPPTDFQLLAPEIVELHRYNGYNCASDIWSAGCLLYSMLSGKRCSFSTISLRDLLLPSMNVDLSERIWLTVSTSAKNLLQRMLTHNPSERISAETALKHPWIRDKNRHGNNRHLHRCIGNMKKFNQRRLRLHNVITISTTNFFLHSLPLINVEERLNNSNWNSNEKISNESNVNESTSVNSDEFKSDEWDMEETVRSTAKYEFLPTKCKIILCKYMKTILRSMEFGELMTDLALPPIQSRDGRHEQIVEERLNYLDKIYNDSTTQKILLILDKIWRKRNVEQEEICDDQMSGHLIDVGVFRDVLLKYIPSTNTSIDENYHIGKGIDVNEKEQTEKDEEEVKELDEEEQQKQSTIQLCDEMKKMKCNRSNSNSKMEMLNGEHLMVCII